MQPNIIGGKYRGKKISVIEASGLRPTGSRVRETLFNWLQTDVHELKTLDLFAGSGLLSFEAISRGANQAILIEKNPKVCQLLKKNAAFFKEENIQIHCMDALQFIKKSDLNHIQLLFVDPPFHHNLYEKTFQALKGKLSPNTLIYIESPEPIETLTLTATLIKQKKAGQVFFALFRT